MLAETNLERLLSGQVGLVRIKVGTLGYEIPIDELLQSVVCLDGCQVVPSS